MNRREWMAGAGALALTACNQSQQPGAAQARPQRPIDPNGDPFAGRSSMADVEGLCRLRHAPHGQPRRYRHVRLVRQTLEASSATRSSRPNSRRPNADTTVARLESAREAFDGFAQPPLFFTPEGGVSAPLACWNPRTAADVSEQDRARPLSRAPPARRRRHGLRIATPCGRRSRRCQRPSSRCMSAPSGEIVAINTPVEMLHSKRPSCRSCEKEKARARCAIARVRQTGQAHHHSAPADPGTARTPSRAAAATGPWVIISTPQSGWFTCGGERGPGIAMSRALSEWAAQKNFPVRWLFIATSGHEWTDFGADIFHQNAGA